VARVGHVAGDVADPGHRRDLVAAAARLGGLDLLVNNASTLGTSPLPPLADYGLEDLRRVFEVNVIAPLALVQDAMPLLHESKDPRVLNVSSDASVEHYETWGGYGAAKAALDHVTGTLGAEQPRVRFWSVDPGDMRTRMHQDAFPGEDISDRPLPETVVPAIVSLVTGDRPSGRYRASELAADRGPEAGGEGAAEPGAQPDTGPDEGRGP
jgi:NAD(P)-dependent dehydrogenase (short-subunit alcohol dehydrogenase family)